MPRRRGFRDGCAAQRAPVRSPKSWPSGAYLRPQVSGFGGVYPACARVDRAPAATGGRRMSADKPAKGLGMGLQALLGETTRPAPGAPAAPAATERGGVREID